MKWLACAHGWKRFTPESFGIIDGKAGVVSIIGDGFDFGATVPINSALAVVASVDDTRFYSAQRIDVFVADPSSLGMGQHVSIVNPSGDSVTVTLPNGISFNQIGWAT